MANMYFASVCLEFRTRAALNAMDPAVLVLDSLQKEVDNGQTPLLVACQKVQQLLLEMSKDDSRLFFRQILPKLLQFILGSQNSSYRAS